MPEPYASDFIDDVALELLILSKCAPLLDSSQSASAVYDVATDTMHVSVNVTETLGMTLPQAIDALGILPLAFGAAWKCLDILVEYALDAAGLVPANGRRWTIAEKTGHTRAGRGQALPLSTDADIWSRTTTAYAALEQARHSLVHRRAIADPAGSLVGTDASGTPLTPVTSAEQDALLRVAQHVAAAMNRGALATRQRMTLLAELDQLTKVTGIASTGTPLVRQQPVVIEVPVTIEQRLDLTSMKLRVRGTFQQAAHIDVSFTVDGSRYLAHLEDVPEGTVAFQPNTLPWLR